MYFFLKLIAQLPLNFLQSFAAAFAWLLYRTNSSMCRVTTVNLQIAYPELDQEQLQQLVQTNLSSQCMTYLEFIKCWGNSAEYSLSLLKTVHGAHYFEEALASKKGVILVVPHLGSWELLNAWINVFANPVIMYKPAKEEGFNRYMLEARQKFNATLVPTDDTGVRAIFKHLKQGGVTVILPDHIPKASGGIYSDFYGERVLSTTLVSKLASKTQCHVLGLSCLRNTDRSEFTVHCKPLSDEILSKDLQLSVDTLNAEMQQMIDVAPEQYIWGYKRFRNIEGKENIYHRPSEK
ncbi:lysophospholipid acyltransferase family protein [Acinetobacter sp. WCHAc010052]|uniref:lysophospholipid acyltransferase family protein n=1 Tax=Acinetobacter sp. WCHAc010052 TaxID=2004647 RepID=UPI000B3D2E43|nr:lysophospholipid acyltransferase family protein [Acinetobacter sp. WCHAc010052]AXY61086.1 lipid A biosynthesis acyltransferase [Acinetobacter sp. WCHAc010052]